MKAPLLLYLTYIDTQQVASGSSVRPVKMLNAFRELGCQVHLVTGRNNQLRTRFQAVRATLRWLKDNRPDCCYVEPPSGPFFCIFDHWLLFRLRLKKIPLAIFIRDAFWKVPETWGVTGIKRLILQLMSRFDWQVVNRTMSRLYFPSESMAQLFPSKCRVSILPPAGEIVELAEPRAEEGRPLNLVYVGAVAKRYGTDLLLDAFARLVQAGQPFVLNLVCRHNEWTDLQMPGKDTPGLAVHHISGSELARLYQSCDIALIPIRKSRYMDFAVPVKLYEYLSFNLPMVVTDCFETARFVRDNQLGLVTESDAGRFAEGISMLAADVSLRQAMRSRASCVLADGNLWVDRARQVIRDLTE